MFSRSLNKPRRELADRDSPSSLGGLLFSLGAIAGLSMTNIVFSPALQAPINISNPTGSLILASDAGGSVHQANPIPGQCALSLVGAAVRLALSITVGTGSTVTSGSTSSVVSGIVTPKTPIVSTVSVSGIAPVVNTPVGLVSIGVFSVSAPSGVANGSIITVNGPSGSFGTKPFVDPLHAGPLLWCPFDTSGSPSPLGRVTSLPTAGPAGSGTFTWQSTGGPNGRGCFASTVTTGAAGVWNWAQGFYMSQWSGWAAADPYGGNNGYYGNDFGVSIYTYRKIKKNFAHLDFNASLSYNGVGGFNLKNWRMWSTLPIGSTNSPSLAYPDIYMGQSDQRLLVEGTTVNVTPTAIQDYTSGGGAGQGQITTNAVVSADGIANQWYAEEVMTTSNSSNTKADANYMWRTPVAPVQGPFLNGSMFQFPTTTYALIGYQYLNAGQGQTLAGNLRGTMTLIFPMHFVMDGTGGSSGHTPLPAGLQLLYAQVYCDDSLCRIVATNSSTWGNETADPQIQIPVTWNDISISFSSYDIPIGWWIYVVNSSNVAKLVGQRIA